MSPPVMLPVDGTLQHSSGSHEPQEDYWREQQPQGREEASTSAAASKTGHADLLFPPCFVTLAGLACWHAPPSSVFFSAPVLFLIFIPSYVIGVFLFVVKLGKFAPPQTRLPGSRLVAASAASLLSASFLSFVAWQLPLIWNYRTLEEKRAVLPLPRLRLRLECATLVLCFSLFLVLQLSLARADPGRVARRAGGGEAKGGASSPPRAAPNHHAGSCATCLTLRPLRSKHCRACDRCTLLFDHHCPVVANCVGSRTLPRFFLFLKVTLTGQFLMLRLAWVAASIAFSGGEDKGTSSPFPSVLAAASVRARGQLLLCVAQTPIFVSTVFLVARGAFCAAANLTVNELANRERYAYLRHHSSDRGGGSSGGGGGSEPSLLYCNRFDRGAARNLAAFFGLEGKLAPISSPPPSRPSPSSPPSSSSSPHGDHYWSEKLDEALAAHGPAGLQPPPFGTKVVRWLDGVRDKRRKRRNSKKGGGEGERSSEFGSTGAGAAAPSVDVELAPLWGGGGGGGGGTTTL
jgi:hypothetical protein